MGLGIDGPAVAAQTVFLIFFQGYQEFPQELFKIHTELGRYSSEFKSRGNTRMLSSEANTSAKAGRLGML